MQVGQQILDVLLTQLLAISWHFISPQVDDIADPLIVGRQTAQRQIFMLEHALEARAFFAASGIGLMTTVALGIVNLASRCLLCIKAEFGIGLAAFHITCAGGDGRDQCQSHQQQSSPIKGLVVHELNLSERS